MASYNKFKNNCARWVDIVWLCILVGWVGDVIELWWYLRRVSVLTRQPLFNPMFQAGLLINQFRLRGLFYRPTHAVFQGCAYCSCSQLSDQCLCRFGILRTDGLYSRHRGRTYWKTNPIRWTYYFCIISILFSSLPSALIFLQRFLPVIHHFSLKN